MSSGELKQGSIEQPESPKFFKVKRVDLSGVHGMGDIGIQRIDDLNDLVLPVVEIKSVPESRDSDKMIDVVVVRPKDIQQAYEDEELSGPASYWEGYAAATTWNDGKQKRHGEISIDVRAGELFEKKSWKRHLHLPRNALTS